MIYDIIIKNGNIYNHKGNIENLNLCIKNGFIIKISDKTEEAKKIIDAKNMIVAPGFVDLHTHEDDFNFGAKGINSEKDNMDFYSAKALLNMGVTTAVGGNCGYSALHLENYKRFIQKEKYLHNYIGLVGYNTLREQIGINNYNKANTYQINKMQNILYKNMKAGAYGFSAGLAYHPGISIYELIKMGEVIAEFNGYFAVHLIGDPRIVEDNLKEMIDVSKFSGVKIQISHLGSLAAYGFMDNILEIIDNASDANIPIKADCYPYDAFSTHIGSAVFDEGFKEKLNCSLNDIEVSQGKYKGKRLTQEIFTDLRENYPDTLIVAHVMNEEEIIKAMKNDNVFIISDITLNNGEGHPRAAGTYPRFLGKYCRDESIMSIHEGLKKCTSKPASWFNINGRGKIAEGNYADIVIFDSDEIIDKSKFNNPLLKPEGIKYVIINGSVVKVDKDIINNNGCWINL